jgi:hypothetical protein
MTTWIFRMAHWGCRHEWLHVRTPLMWRLECLHCGATTAGMPVVAVDSSAGSPVQVAV